MYVRAKPLTPSEAAAGVASVVRCESDHRVACLFQGSTKARPFKCPLSTSFSFFHLPDTLDCILVECHLALNFLLAGTYHRKVSKASRPRCCCQFSTLHGVRCKMSCSKLRAAPPLRATATLALALRVQRYRSLTVFVHPTLQAYDFDRVFGPASRQEEVFADVSQLVTSALDGYNGARRPKHTQASQACVCQGSL